MSKFFKSAAAVAAVSVLLLVGGCGGGTSTGKDTSTEQSKAAVEGKTEGGRYAVVLKTLSSEFWQKMETGIKDKADELGVTVDIYAANSEDDVEGQVSLAENLLDQGYDGLALAPLTGDNLISVISKATAAGIPVVNLDEQVNMESLAESGGASLGFVTTDNVEVGSEGAGYIISRIGAEGGEVAIIEGKAGTASGEARKLGATEAFNDANGIKLVDSQPADWDRTRAFDLATNLINKYPELKGIYCANDTMAMGAQQAVEESGKDIVVVGTDGNADAVASVKAGQLAATVAQDSAGIGAEGLQMLVDFVVAGTEFNKDTVTEEAFIPAILITRES